MRTGHLSGVPNNEVGTKPHVQRETGASAVARPSLAQRALRTLGAGLRNFAGIDDRPAAVINLHAA